MTDIDDVYEETDITTNTIPIFHDYREVMTNYQELKKTYKTKPILTKYEKTKIIGIRAQQIASGAKPLIDVPNYLTNSIDIAELELTKRKTPFIVKKKFGNSFEYWKIEDLTYF